MDKLILCLANSSKHGGRCIAGIEIQLNGNQLSIVRSDNGTPKWIRPISHSAAGEVPMSHANGVYVFSIVKVCGISYAGTGSHAEDYYYQRLEVQQTLNPSDSFLRNYTDSLHNCIFGNRGKALTPEAFERGDYSVMLIRTENSEIYLDERFAKPKARVKFSFNGNIYDFPITDPEFKDKLHVNRNLYKGYDLLYIVASLGVEHDGWHSKLAATIIIPSTVNIKESISVAQPKAVFQQSIGDKPVYRNVSPLNTSSTNSTITNSSYPRKPESTSTRNTYQPSKPAYTSNRKSSSNNNGGCYLATAVYGSYDCQEVWTLRRFRDYKLSKTWYGRAFIHLYYVIGPTLVKWFGKEKWFNKILKEPLDCLVNKLQSKGFKNTPYNDQIW